MKDNFSKQSDQYAKYRPTYPSAFFEYLKGLMSTHENAWDCGTGNGQVAIVLANTFENVYASDISASQIANAPIVENIHYSIQAAEQTSFKDDFFDLIVVAQAIHWFDFEKFYDEVLRTAKDGAFIVVIGYGRVEISPEIDAIINHFYHNVIGKYWDAERRYIDENYQTIPFPFEEIAAPNINNTYEWTFEHLLGYLSTWSAVKHYIRINGVDPVDALAIELGQVFGNEFRQVHFPLLLRIGRIVK